MTDRTNAQTAASFCQYCGKHHGPDCPSKAPTYGDTRNAPQASELSDVQAEAYRILRARYPETPRSELLEILTGAELEHEYETAVGKSFADCLVCQAKESLEEAELCAAGLCDHYTCTEGRSIDEWIEPEDVDRPTAEGDFADDFRPSPFRSPGYGAPLS